MNPAQTESKVSRVLILYAVFCCLLVVGFLKIKKFFFYLKPCTEAVNLYLNKGRNLNVFQTNAETHLVLSRNNELFSP
jgi:hypothetical protein